MKNEKPLTIQILEGFAEKLKRTQPDEPELVSELMTALSADGKLTGKCIVELLREVPEESNEATET